MAKSLYSFRDLTWFVKYFIYWGYLTELKSKYFTWNTKTPNNTLDFILLWIILTNELLMLNFQFPRYEGLGSALDTEEFWWASVQYKCTEASFQCGQHKTTKILWSALSYRELGLALYYQGTLISLKLPWTWVSLILPRNSGQPLYNTSL